jgi:hypothetical protein
MAGRLDPTFHATAKLAMEAAPETYAYTLMLSPDFSQPDGLGVVAWDNQFYPDGVPGAMVKADVGTNGGLTLDKAFWVEFPKGYRSHQIRLEGGDCSTDSFCYPSV